MFFYDLHNKQLSFFNLSPQFTCINMYYIFHKNEIQKKKKKIICYLVFTEKQTISNNPDISESYCQIIKTISELTSNHKEIFRDYQTMVNIFSDSISNNIDNFRVIIK